MPASSGIRLGRLVHEECLAAIEALDSDQNVHLRIHQARKAIRRARSLIALVARELDTGTADGSGAAALGGGATSVPWPGSVPVEAGMRFAPLAIGISSSWPTRTPMSGPSPFHEASAVVETP